MADEQSKITGSCLCGEVTYESKCPPFRTGFCHCRMCQKSLGNVFGTAAFFGHEDFEFTGRDPKWFHSSDVAKRAFCQTCGSPVAYQHDSVQHIAVWMGTLDHPEAFEPQVHWYTDTRLPWVDIMQDLEDATDELDFDYRGDRSQ